MSWETATIERELKGGAEEQYSGKDKNMHAIYQQVIHELKSISSKHKDG